MSGYFDASALAAIVFRDEGWQIVAAWLQKQDDQSILSDFCWGEFNSAVGNRVRRRELTDAEGTALIVAAESYLAGWKTAPLITADIVDAIAMLAHFALGLRLPDAIHLAIARRLGIVLVSTDAQQVHAARALGIAVTNPLEPDDIRS